MAAQMGRVFGTAGGGLTDASWAVNADVARVGQRGEVATADILDRLAERPGGATVLHDVNIPIPGFTANIDHVVVAGGRVWLVDSKVWKPGFYWTLSGRTYRGFERVKHLEKKTMVMAAEAVGGYLRKRGLKARLVGSVVVAHPSSRRSALRLWAVRFPGAVVMLPGQFERAAKRFMKPGAAAVADPAVVAALARLLNQPARPAAAGRRAPTPAHSRRPAAAAAVPGWADDNNNTGASVDLKGW